jgi:hypothetical protein
MGWLILPILAACAMALPASALATPFPVTTTADTGAGSLRQAITDANANAGPDTIPISATGTIDLAGVLPSISDDVDIQGPGQDQLTVRRNTGGNYQIFNIFSDNTVSISGLTVSNGHLIGSNRGAGIESFGALTLDRVTVSANSVVATSGSISSAQGGGIAGGGTLDMSRSTVTGNTVTASGGTSITTAQAAGIQNGGGTFNIDRSTVSGNTATSTGGPSVVAAGGGIQGSGTFNIDRSTVSGNAVSASAGSVSTVARAGGISLSAATDATNVITNSTVTANSAVSSDTQSGANAVTFGTNSFRNTIVSNPVGGATSCATVVTSAGHNLEDGTSCGFDEATDLPSTDPLLASLADNGGPTETHALPSGSPAIDKGVSSCGTTDQRELPRPIDNGGAPNAPGGDGTDIGAFESQVDSPPNTTIDSGPAAGSLINDRTPTFGLSATEICSTFQCKADSGSFSTCTSPHTTASLEDGEHTVSVRAVDAAHNPDSTPASRTFTVDATAPDSAIDKGPKKRVKTKKKKAKAKFLFSADEQGASLECSLDGESFESCTSPLKLKVKKGKHSFEVRATDQAGNVDTTPAERKWKVKRKKKR